MTEEDKIKWLAGFIDGEGCIYIKELYRKDRKYSGSRLEVSIGNTALSILKDIQLDWGGNIARKLVYGKNPKPCYEWRCSQRKALALLQAIYPYLRIKNGQAKVGIDFQEFIINRHICRRGLSEAEVVLRNAQRKHLQELKRVIA